MTTSHFVHGLSIMSEIELFEPSACDGRATDLNVSVGRSRESDLDGDQVLSFSSGRRVLYRALKRDDHWTIQAPGIASFDVVEGSMVAHLDPRCEVPGLLSLLLAGTGLAFYLMIHGELCLHASAVEVDGRCIAFAGASGRGKTTMAALACAAGHPLFGDDLLRARIDETGVSAFRGSSEIRLRPAIVELADRIKGEQRTTLDERTSVRPLRSEHEMLDLAAIVLPRPDRECTDVRARRLHGADAFSGLAECPRLLGWRTAEMMNGEFDHLLKLSSAVPIVEVCVPWQTTPQTRVVDDAIESALALCSHAP